MGAVDELELSILAQLCQASRKLGHMILIRVRGASSHL